ncbi:hypothetical protein I7I48_05917 [Histoplasma ohiense]|nr:hypothetical protein I7I48_05917 [Histoplasma ohiense (nom. inval.)]
MDTLIVPPFRFISRLLAHFSDQFSWAEKGLMVRLPVGRNSLVLRQFHQLSPQRQRAEKKKRKTRKKGKRKLSSQGAEGTSFNFYPLRFRKWREPWSISYKRNLTYAVHGEKERSAGKN